MADKIRDWLVEKYPADGKCDSPMEALFAAAFKFMPGYEPVKTARMEQQAAIGKYRADFCFTINTVAGEPKRLVVEIDGHDFHERTKEQAAHDKQRDRFMLAAGYEVMRYTGSELWANPFAAVAEVHQRLYVLRYGCSPKHAAARAALEDLRQFFEGGK